MNLRHLILILTIIAVIPFNAYAQKDSAGKPIVYGNIKPGDLDDSRVSFSGKKVPKIIRFRWRTRDNSVVNEYLRFQNDTPYSDSFSRAFTETASSYYSDAVTDRLQDEKVLLTRAKSRFKNIGWFSEVKESSNREGDFNYVIAGGNAEAHDKCIYVWQGFNAVETSMAGTFYKSLVSFSYCAKNTNEKDLLEYYSSIRVRGE
jgi:hypothetical protein